MSSGAGRRSGRQHPARGTRHAEPRPKAYARQGVRTPTLKESRVAFIEQLERYLPFAGEQKRFVETLDYFIEWSRQQPTLLAHFDHDADPCVVSFTRVADGTVLWSASPRRGDGAKFEVVPRQRRTLTADRREDALASMRAISRQPITDESPFQVTFAALKGAGGREQMVALMERILQDPPATRGRARAVR